MARFFTVDRIIGVVLLLLCGVFTALAFDLVNSIPPFFKNQPMRLDTMPRMLGIVGIIAAVVTIIAPNTGAPAPTKNEKLKASQERMADLSFANFGSAKWGQLCAMIALMIVYAAFLRPIGFLPATFAMLFVGSLILGERRWLGMTLVSLIAPLAIWSLVTFVLNRTIPPLPRAVLDMIGG